MENITGFMDIKKSVILEIPAIILTTITVTDTLFLTKMQKGKTGGTILPHDNTKIQPC
jgi:hypothetical protein